MSAVRVGWDRDWGFEVTTDVIDASIDNLPHYIPGVRSLSVWVLSEYGAKWTYLGVPPSLLPWLQQNFDTATPNDVLAELARCGVSV